MNPVLRKLRQTKTREQIANLLEKHIGDGSNQGHCRQAYDALLLRGRDEDAKLVAEFARALTSNDGDWCAGIHAAIASLRIKQL